MKSSKSASPFLIIAMPIVILIAIALHQRGATVSPFSPGLYDNAISGKIAAITHGKIYVRVKLEPANIICKFIPVFDPSLRSFQEVANVGDSLWKPAHSDSLYVINKESKQRYGWRFERRDRTGWLHPRGH